MPTTGNHRKRLTQKEQEVLELIKHGKSNADIATHMNITERTVKYHVSNIMDKLNASNRAHAVAKAMENGVLSNEKTMKNSDHVS